MIELMKSQRLVQLLKNSAVLFLSSKSQIILVFIQSIVVARGLGVAGYGQWAIAVVFGTLLMNFLSLKTDDILGKFIVDLKTAKSFSLLEAIFRKTLWFEFLMRLAGLAAIIGLSTFAARWFKGPEQRIIYIVYGSFLFLQFSNATWFSLERDNGHYKVIAWLDFLNSFFRLGFICFFFLLLKDVTIEKLALSFLVSGCILFIIKWVRISKMLKEYGISLRRVLSPFKGQAAKSSGVFREYWTFMRATYFSTCFSFLIKKMDILAAGYFFSTESVGLLRLAKNLSKIIQDAAANMANPVYQDFNELIAAGKEKRILEFLKKNLKYYLGGLAAGLSILSLFVAPFIRLVYGVEYVGASAFFRVYLVLVFLVLSSFWTSPLVLALKGWNYKLKMFFSAFLFMCVTILLFKHLWGIMGIVISIIATRFVLEMSFFVFIWRKLSREQKT